MLRLSLAFAVCTCRDGSSIILNLNQIIMRRCESREPKHFFEINLLLNRLCIIMYSIYIDFNLSALRIA